MTIPSAHGLAGRLRAAARWCLPALLLAAAPTQAQKAPAAGPVGANPTSEFLLGLQAEPRLLQRDIFAADGPVIGQFVLQDLQFTYDLETMLSMPGAGDYGYLMTGQFRAETVGDHDFVGIVAVPASGGLCAVRLVVDGTVVFEKQRSARRESFTLSAAGRAMLRPGLHAVAFWVACRVRDPGQTKVTMLLKAPGDPDFKVAPISRFTHSRR